MISQNKSIESLILGNDAPFSAEDCQEILRSLKNNITITSLSIPECFETGIKLF